MRAWLVAALGLLVVSLFLFCAYAGTKPPTPGDPDIVEGQKPPSRSPIVVIAPRGEVFTFVPLGVWFYWQGERINTAYRERCIDSSKECLSGVPHRRWLRR